MTAEEKAAAFDALAKALTNQWHDGRWSWWCRTPPGGPLRDTREEAVADLLAWALRQKGRPPHRPPPRAFPLALDVIERPAP